MVGPGLSAPPIHDITTDIENPPEFVAAKAARADGENSTEFEADVAAQQKAAFPDLTGIDSELGQIEAFNRSLEVIEELNWTVLAKDDINGRIEAYEETAMFGFIDEERRPDGVQMRFLTPVPDYMARSSGVTQSTTTGVTEEANMSPSPSGSTIVTQSTVVAEGERSPVSSVVSGPPQDADAPNESSGSIVVLGRRARKTVRGRSRRFFRRIEED